METEQDKYQNLQKNRAGGFGAIVEGRSNSEASLSNKDSQQKYNELQGKRIEDAKQNAREKIIEGTEDKNKNKSRIPTKRKLSLRNVSSKDAVFAAAAFTAIDFQKDGFHFAVIIFSLIADGITIIPIVGSFLAIPISILIWILYAIGGHLKHRVGRKAVITGVSQACELFGFMGLSFLPFYTISALINYWLALIERKRGLE